MDNQRSRPPCAHSNIGCVEGCPLAPYFPAGRVAEYANAHRLFSRRRLIAMIIRTSPELREDLMRSIIFEANMRSTYPTRGCSDLILNLWSDINDHMAKLEEVNRQIIRILRNGQDPMG